MEFTILLLDKEEGRSEGRNQGSNITTSGHIIEESVKSCLFYRTERVDLAVVFRDGFRFEINSVIPFAEWREFV